MIRKIYRVVTCVLAIGMLAACGHKTEDKPVTVSELEEAHNAGREAAKIFVSRQYTDTFQLQELLLEANSQGARFDSITRLRAAYDSAFISTIRTVRPQVAAELERYGKEHHK